MYKLEFGEELLLLLFTKNIIQRPGSHLYKRVLWSHHDPWERNITNLSPHTHTIKIREKLDFSLFSYPIYGGKCFLKEADFYILQQAYQVQSTVCVHMFGWVVWSQSRSTSLLQTCHPDSL